jgi:hypothetical protein
MFRKAILSHLFFLLTPPMKMELQACSETLAHKIQTAGNHPKEKIQNPVVFTVQYPKQL